MHNPGKHAKFPPETLDFDEDHRERHSDLPVSQAQTGVAKEPKMGTA